jgi:uncharacterized protein (DUF697 family)
MTSTIASLDDLERVRSECKALATKNALGSAVAAAIPAPGFDILVDAKLLVDLLPQISERFGLSHKQVAKLDPKYAEQILVAATSMGNQFIARAVTQKIVLAVLKTMGVKIAARSVAKYIPFVGTALSATISFSAMKLLANRHVEDCYQAVKHASFAGAGPSVLTLDPAPSLHPDPAAA